MKLCNLAHRVMTPELAAIALTGLMVMMAQPARPGADVGVAAVATSGDRIDLGAVATKAVTDGETSRID